ncbi:Na-translocating system protein MpsC family protein, partial [Streptomyces sp. MS2A]|nr:Na-translocating system protein MpsC family protein [Streptomyces sp. MS2A]
KEGLLSIKRTRSGLVESGIEQLSRMMKKLTGEETISFHTDISTHTGERIMVFKLANDLQKKLS